MSPSSSNKDLSTSTLSEIFNQEGDFLSASQAISRFSENGSRREAQSQQKNSSALKGEGFLIHFVRVLVQDTGQGKPSPPSRIMSTPPAYGRRFKIVHGKTRCNLSFTAKAFKAVKRIHEKLRNSTKGKVFKHLFGMLWGETL